MKIALAQVSPIVGDIEGNSRIISDAIRAAEAQGAELIVCPELTLTGYLHADLVDSLAFLRHNRRALDQLIALPQRAVVVVGFIDFDETKRNDDGSIRKYNAAAVFSHARLLGIAHKSLLPNYRFFDEKRHFHPAERVSVINAPIANRNVTIGVTICEDIWDTHYAVKPIAELARMGAELIVNISASPFAVGKRAERVKLLRAHARSADAPIVYSNMVGIADNGKNIIPFDGESMLCDARGMIRHMSARYAPALDVIDLPLDARTSTQIAMPQRSWEEETLQTLLYSLREYAQRSGFTAALQSVSGGIDSALGVALAAEALGADRVQALSLPSQYNSAQTRSIAREVCANCGVSFRELAIDELHAFARQTLSGAGITAPQRLTDENLQARLRGVLMMALSNERRALLISNSNKTEIALGYATLYGDMCGGIAPLGDLGKHHVYRLARYLNQRAGRVLIPDAALTIRPSAELSPGQFDPFDYELVAPLVDAMINERLSPSELIERFGERSLSLDLPSPGLYERIEPGAFAELCLNLYRLMRGAVFKRLQGPPIVTLSQRSFGFDLRETLINRWSGL